MPDPMLATFAFALGAVVGSFLNVVILRLPAEISIVFPASRCPACQTPIRWHDNLPILGFLMLRGRCRHCRERISWQYPLVEAAMGLLTVALLRHFGLSLALPIYFLFCAALLAVIFIDLRHQIIPDVISLPGILIGLAASFINPLVSWQDAALGVLAGGGSFYLIALGYYLITKQEGMGGGDIKLLAMIGAFLGWRAVPFVVFGSALMGTVVGVGAMLKQGKGGKTVIPYGPFLAVAAMGYLFFEHEILLAFSRYVMGG
ncbi:MAG: prepilin peptidase [Thermodesulfobacteriota bacterium]